MDQHMAVYDFISVADDSSIRKEKIAIIIHLFIRRCSFDTNTIVLQGYKRQTNNKTAIVKSEIPLSTQLVEGFFLL